MEQQVDTPELLAQRLLGVFAPGQRVAVALSGGIDSTVVAKAAFLALGPGAVAVTSDSPSVPRAELAEAQAMARLIGIRHEVLATQELANPDYIKNDGARCYFCKSELYDTILNHLHTLGADTICSGANLDDLGDYRPGLVAAAERKIRHPLQEAQFTKAAVRQLAQHWGLPIWDKPASPCLSSRLVPGVAVTPERLTRIEQGELYLKAQGLRDCRVRLHEGELARIEVPSDEIHRLAAPGTRAQLTKAFQELGFRFITLDLIGLKSGNLNDLVPLEIKQRYHLNETILAPGQS
jgi:uncharacterized protein